MRIRTDPIRKVSGLWGRGLTFWPRQTACKAGFDRSLPRKERRSLCRKLFFFRFSTCARLLYLLHALPRMGWLVGWLIMARSRTTWRRLEQKRVTWAPMNQEAGPLLRKKPPNTYTCMTLHYGILASYWSCSIMTKSHLQSAKNYGLFVGTRACNFFIRHAYTVMTCAKKPCSFVRSTHSVTW